VKTGLERRRSEKRHPLTSCGRDGIAILLEPILVASRTLEHRALDGLEQHVRWGTAEVDETEALAVSLIFGREGHLGRDKRADQ